MYCTGYCLCLSAVWWFPGVCLSKFHVFLSFLLFFLSIKKTTTLSDTIRNNMDQFRVNCKPAKLDTDIFSQHPPADSLRELRWKLILAFFIRTRDSAPRNERYSFHYFNPQCNHINLSEPMKEASFIQASSSTEDIWGLTNPFSIAMRCRHCHQGCRFSTTSTTCQGCKYLKYIRQLFRKY